MKGKLGLLCLTALALCFALGCASAQTRQSVCEELGVCDYADFAEWDYDISDYSEESLPSPLPEVFDSERGMTLWQMPMKESRYGSQVSRDYLLGWFVSNGVLSQADFDLDDDGQDEWLVLCVRPGEPDELGQQFPELFLRVYEASGDEVELADELCLNHSLDFIERVRVDALRFEGQTLLGYQTLGSFDDMWLHLWLVAYEDGAFSVRAGFERFSGGGGYDWLCVHGSETDAHQTADIDLGSHYGDSGSFLEEAEWDLYREHYRQALDAVPDAAELLEQALSPMGGTSMLEDDPCSCELSGVALELLDIDNAAYAPDGAPVLAIRFR